MASGNTLSIFTPLSYEPPSSGMATIGIRSGRHVLNFDDTTDEYAMFTNVLPQQYGSNGLTAYVHYTTVSATGVGQFVGWKMSFERIGDNILSLDTDSFAYHKVGSGTVPNTLGLVDVVSISFSDGSEIDALQAGEFYRIKLGRDTSNDNAPGDAQFIALELREG